MMSAMVTHNLFAGYKVGTNNPMVVSHLHFADATLLVGIKSWANVCALRAVLVSTKVCWLGLIFLTLGWLKQHPF